MTFLKRRLIVFVNLTLGLVLVSPQLESCCFFPFGEEYRFWFMQPGLGNDNNLYSFFFSSDHYYGDMTKGSYIYDAPLIYYPPEPTAYAENIQEWKERMKPWRLKDTDVHRLLYETKSIDFLSFEADVESKTAEKTHPFYQNSFFNALHQPSCRQLLNYFIYAKKSESLSSQEDPWDTGGFDQDGIACLIREGKQKLEESRDPFLKDRYAYQLMRLAHYAGDRGLGNDIYENRFSKQKWNTWIKASALFYLLQLERDRKDYTYQLSKVFEVNTDKRDRILKLFQPKELPAAMCFVKNKREEALLYAMKELMYPGQSLHSLEKIYQLDPLSKELGTLLVREINKIEDWVYTPELTKLEPANYFLDRVYTKAGEMKRHRLDLEYMRQVQSFIQVIADKGYSADPKLWKLAAAHMALLTGNIGDCQDRLIRIERESGKDSRFEAQIKVLSLVADASTQAGRNPGFPERVLKDIYWLDKHPEKVFENHTLTSQLLLFLSNKFIQNGDVATGVLLLTKDTRPLGMVDMSGTLITWEDLLHEKGKPKDYDKLITLVRKKNKNEFERYFSRDSNLVESRLLDGKGTYFVIHDELDSAYTVFKKVPPDFWETSGYATLLNVNPFYVDHIEAHRRNKQDSIKYHNKAKFVGRMLELKKEIRMGHDVSKNNYLLGNAYYSMTWFGNSWRMVRSYWSSSEVGVWSREVFPDTFNKIYYGCSRAQDYYLKGMYTGRDKRLASLCALMAGICRRNNEIYTQLCGPDYEKTFDYKHRTNYWLPYIKRNFGDAQDFMDFSECKFLDSYIASIVN